MCYNCASSCKSIVMFLMLISNIVFLIASMVLQLLPHLQKLDGFTKQMYYSTNHIYLQHVLCLDSVNDACAVFLKIVSGIQHSI